MNPTISMNPCGKCQLKYSSYCVDCINAWCGMGYKNYGEYLKYKMKTKSESEVDL